MSSRCSKITGVTATALLLSVFVASGAFIAPEENAEFANWKFSLSSGKDVEGAEMVLRAEPGKNAEPVFITVTCRRNGRDQAAHWALSPDEGIAEKKFTLPLPENGVKSLGRYTVKTELSSGTRTLTIPMTFAKENSSELFTYVTSNNADNSFGTCTHFDFGADPDGPYRGWHDYKRLLDMISNAGLKYIRSGIGMEKDAAGAYRVREYDREWMRYAAERGITPIVLIDMSADESVEEFLKRIDAYVRDCGEFSKIFELGNEPNNFGNWMGKHGGMWNGKTEDGKNAKWLLEHLRYTNAGAEHLKKLLPDATILALGSPAPCNFRVLDTGLLSEAVDGIVDHPYNYCLPPERIPYGTGFLERDGVISGDDACTFAGVMAEYHRKNGGRKMFLTEFGFTTMFFNGKNEGGLLAGYSEEAQACYLVRRFLEASYTGVAAICQYAFMDDLGSAENEQEANFGLIRADYSPKLSYWAIRNLTALYNNAVFDSSLAVTVAAAPLQKGAVRGKLVDWDKVEIMADNGVKAFAYRNSQRDDLRMAAVWSALPFSGEFPNRTAALEFIGYQDFSDALVAVDIITGEMYDVPFTVTEEGKVTAELSLGNHPIVLIFAAK